LLCSEQVTGLNEQGKTLWLELRGAIQELPGDAPLRLPNIMFLRPILCLVRQPRTRVL